MRVLLSSFGSRGDVEPMLGLAVQLRAQGAQVRVCAPPDFAELLAEVGVSFVPAGPSVRRITAGPDRWQPCDIKQRATELLATQYRTVCTAAADCDVVVATGLFPATAAARAVSEKLGLGYVFVSFFATLLPSPHHRPHPWPGRPLPPEPTDNNTLWELNAQHMNELFGEVVNEHRVTVGLPTVDNVRDHVYTDRPWLAADPVLGPWPHSADRAVVQTGAWLRPDDRRLPSDLLAFLTAGPPPVYVGFGSMPMLASADVAAVAIEAVRAQGRRVVLSRGWADLSLVDDRDDCFAVGEVDQQALFGRVAAVVHHGGAGTTTTAARAGAPQVLVPQLVDQPYWAERVVDLGIGAALAGPVPTVASLSAALQTALAPETRDRAAAVAHTIRADGAAVAAHRLITTYSRDMPPVSA
ncbi:glycosyltransferase [Nocardia brasiliensis]|uniref:glycosyltransferase n=1 Tax=Nocardia brasiliensis TaxID=37326 RepID=UPI002454B1AE|nr:glycosyltransferase [Nocardia brasiliensis]